MATIGLALAMVACTSAAPRSPRPDGAAGTAGASPPPHDSGASHDSHDDANHPDALDAAADAGDAPATGAGGATRDAGVDLASDADHATTSCDADPGYALQFRGTGDDRVQATIAALPTGRASRTIELWAWFDGSSSSWVNEKGLFETGDRNGAPAGGCHEFALNSTTWSDGQALAVLHPYGNCDPVDNYLQLPSDTFPAGSKTGWVHISFAYDGQANRFEFTINGSAMLANGPGQPAARTHAETDWPAPASWGTTSYAAPLGNLLTIGTTPQFSGPPGWQGKIDELRVWSVFRTADQIKGNMRVHLKGTEPGLVAYYKFDEGTGLATADATNDATNAAAFVGADKMTWPKWVKSDIPGTFTCAP
ncbi:MAG TPA: hypothetical protein VH560_01460 [Polyangia bacterium]|nr:hypothetical protein [Polyangia bacterium]